MSTPPQTTANRPASHARKWVAYYAALVRYADNTGHASPPTTWVAADGVRLGQWVSTQRKNYSQGRMPAERIHLLERLPGWLWDAYDTRWRTQYAALLRYAADTGHACPPCTWVAVDGVRLGRWVSGQRKKHYQGRLSAKRTALLEALPGWVWRIDLSAEWERDWDTAFLALEHFTKIHGHAQPTWETKFGEFNIGTWVSRQRQRNRDAVMHADRARALESLPGWVWDARAGRPPALRDAS